MRVLLVAANVFRGILSRRALYIWAVAILLMFLRSMPAFFMNPTDPRILAYIRHNAISEALGMWSVLCIASALFLGAASVSSEIVSKTLVTVLARPIHRWELLLGKWLGVCAFAMVTMAIGVALALGLASFLDLDVSYRALAMALTDTFVAILMLGALATALSSLSSTGLAAALTVLLVFVPGVVATLRAEGMAVKWQRLGRAIDVVIPSGYQGLYGNVAWAPRPMRVPPGMTPPAQQRPVSNTPENRKKLYEDAVFAGIYLLLGMFFFSRRDVKAS